MISKKEEILNATVTLFSQKGYHLSVSDIAKKVAIKPPSIYSHFQSKDEIIEQIVVNEIENFYGTISNKYLENILSLTCKEQLEHIFKNVLEYFDNMQRLRFWKNITLIDNEPLREKCKNIIRKNEMGFYQIFEDLFHKAIQQHEIKESVHEGHKLLFLAMLQGLLNELFMYNNLICQYECATKIWNVYWDSIKVECPSC